MKGHFKTVVDSMGGAPYVQKALAAILAPSARKHLGHCLPEVAEELSRQASEQGKPVKELMHKLPERSRFRPSLVLGLAQDTPANMLKETFDVNPNYVRNLRHRRKKEEIPLYLYDEKVSGGGPVRERDAVRDVEIKKIVAFSKQEMVIKSGSTHYTFKLEQQKQILLEKFQAAYPRLLREAVKEDPTLVAPNGCQKMTILHRNIEFARYLAEQPGFVEGDAADTAQRQRIRQSPREARGKLGDVALCDFDAANWECVPRNPKWYWAALNENGLKFSVVYKPHDCTVCLQGPVYIAEQKKLAERLVDAAAVPHEELTLLQQRQRVVQKKITDYERHVRQMTSQRAYSQSRDAWLREKPGVRGQIFEDFGAYYDLGGNKCIDLVFFIRYCTDHGVIEHFALHNFCTDPDQASEDSHCVRDVWLHHLLVSGELAAFKELDLQRDTGSHFHNNNILLLESRLFSLTGCKLQVNTLGPRHGYNNCDGEIARVASCARQAAVAGCPPYSEYQWAAMINNHPKFAHARGYYFKEINRDPSNFPSNVLDLPRIKEMCEFQYHFTDQFGKEVREEGYVRARQVTGTGPYVFHDLLKRTRPKAWGRMCQPCSNHYQRPVHHKKPGELINKCTARRGQARNAESSSISNEALLQPSVTRLDRSKQPAPKRIRRANKGNINEPSKIVCPGCAEFPRVLKNYKGFQTHWRSAHRGLPLPSAADLAAAVDGALPAAPGDAGDTVASAVPVASAVGDSAPGGGVASRPERPRRKKKRFKSVISSDEEADDDGDGPGDAVPGGGGVAPRRKQRRREAAPAAACQAEPAAEPAAAGEGEPYAAGDSDSEHGSDSHSDDLALHDEGVFEVKELLEKRVSKGKTWYLVQWSPVEQYPEPTWEPYKSISQCNTLLRQFRKREKDEEDKRGKEGAK